MFLPTWIVKEKSNFNRSVIIHYKSVADNNDATLLTCHPYSIKDFVICGLHKNVLKLFTQCIPIYI